MLPTQSAGPGTFSNFDLRRVPSPCFVVDEIKVMKNLRVLREIGDRTGARMLLALKAFSMFGLSSLIDEFLDGCCASGLWEARLAREKGFAEKKKGKVLSTFSPAYLQRDLGELCELSDHLVFNHPLSFLIEKALKKGVSLGLRINPLHSEGLDDKYDPCAKGSRLGWPIDRLSENDLDCFQGLHFHTLCEQNFPPLLRTWNKIERDMGSMISKFEWINLGGGHHCTRPDYDLCGLIELILSISKKYNSQVIMEPGEAVVWDAGILVGEVLDVMTTDQKFAFLDLSPTCHTPDVLEAPYRPALLGEASDGGHPHVLGGISCLTADSYGSYNLKEDLRVGDRVAFLDQAHYTMVKTNTFNGVKLPAIAVWNSTTDELRVIREFEYDDFANRLS